MKAKLSSSVKPSSTAVAAAAIMHTFLHDRAQLFEHPPLHSLLTSSLTPSVTARLFMACAVTPYAGITYPDKRTEKLAVELAIREGLKCGNKNHYLDGIPALFHAADKFRTLRSASLESTGQNERVAIGIFHCLLLRPDIFNAINAGLLLRDASVHKPLMDSYWTSSLLFSLVQELVQYYDAENDRFNGSLWNLFRLGLC